jgi:hypothetical protein
MDNLIFGIGSRVKHEKFGAGVVVQVWPDNYEIVFMDYGHKTDHTRSGTVAGHRFQESRNLTS